IQRPENPVIKFMPYCKFRLLQWQLRPFEHSKTDETASLPKAFQAPVERSRHIQVVSTEIFVPDSYLAVDEYTIRYAGLSN
ncbi:hypothetical protein FOC4_g10002975, partial [Fusarium odoratissimum]